MIPDQLVNRRKNSTPFIDGFGTKGNGKSDCGDPLRPEFI
jgi:hypothetical protein